MDLRYRVDESSFSLITDLWSNEIHENVIGSFQDLFSREMSILIRVLSSSTERYPRLLKLIES